MSNTILISQNYTIDVTRIGKNGKTEQRYITCNDTLLTQSSNLIKKQDESGKINVLSMRDREIFVMPYPPHPLEIISSNNEWISLGNNEYSAVYKKIKGYSYSAKVYDQYNTNRTNFKGLLNLIYHPKGIFKELKMYTPYDTITFSFDVIKNESCQIPNSPLNFNPIINSEINVDDFIHEPNLEIIAKEDRITLGKMKLLNEAMQPFILDSLKSELYLIDFWASWCQPCIREFEFLKNVQNKFENNLELISISFDTSQDIAKWKTATTKHEITWTSLILPDGFESPIAKKWDIKSVPRYMILDKDLRLIYSDAPAPSNVELSKIINSLLSTNDWK